MTFSVGQVATAAALNAVTLSNVTTYVPAFTSAGTITYTTQTGWYYTISSKLVFFNAYIVVNSAGTGGSNVTLNAPTNIERTNRQVVTALALAASTNGTWTFQANTSGSGTTFDRVNNSTGSQIIGTDLSAGAIIAIQGLYRQA